MQNQHRRLAFETNDLCFFCKRQQGINILSEYLFRSYFFCKFLNWIYVKRSARSPCYFTAMLAVIFQCSVKRVSAIEGYEMPEFSSCGFYPGNRLSEPIKYIIFQVSGHGIQSFQFSQNFTSKYNSSLGNSFFRLLRQAM